VLTSAGIEYIKNPQLKRYFLEKCHVLLPFFPGSFSLKMMAQWQQKNMFEMIGHEKNILKF